MSYYFPSLNESLHGTDLRDKVGKKPDGSIFKLGPRSNILVNEYCNGVA